MANCIAPNFDANYEVHLKRLDHRSRATSQLLIVELLLRKFYLRHNVYPQSLAELAPTFPAVSFEVDGKPLGYRNLGDDFLLYSWGFDGDDDGGRPAVDRDDGRPDNLDGDGDIQLRTHFAERKRWNP